MEPVFDHGKQRQDRHGRRLRQRSHLPPLAKCRQPFYRRDGLEGNRNPAIDVRLQIGRVLRGRRLRGTVHLALNLLGNERREGRCVSRHRAMQSHREVHDTLDVECESRVAMFWPVRCDNAPQTGRAVHCAPPVATMPDMLAVYRCRCRLRPQFSGRTPPCVHRPVQSVVRASTPVSMLFESPGRSSRRRCSQEALQPRGPRITIGSACVRVRWRRTACREGAAVAPSTVRSRLLAGVG